MMLISLILSLLSAPPADSVQVPPRLLSEAEILCIEAEDQRMACEFSQALGSYRKALSLSVDSLRRVALDSLSTLCRNGLAMSEFCYRPKVAARERFALSEIIDYYPLTKEQRARLSAFPVDTLMLADSSKIAAFFPIESDGCIYFSSRELFGMGGADLYRCKRIPGTPFVGAPENLGFPYSSPADDYLLLNTPDGDFTIFASNRGCSADSVNLYAIVREVVPVRGKVEEGASLRELCALAPRSVLPASDAQRQALAAYRQAEKDFAEQQDSLSRHNRELEALRRRYAVASGDERQFLAGEISRMEMALPALHRKSAAVAARLRDAEADCRRSGLQVEPSVRRYTFKKQ